jgi:putative ABC transport system substrate-binding protein
MRRREFIVGIAVLAGSLSNASAEKPSVPLIGFLLAGSEPAYTGLLRAFREAMGQLGYVEGKNLRFEYRFAQGELDRLPGLATDLVLLNPNVIVSAPLPANIAAHQATSTIPIVIANGADPVGFGLVKSLSHPGGNVTGLANFAEVLASKQIDVLRELFPRLSTLGVLVNSANPLHVPQLKETTIAATVNGLALAIIEVTAASQLPSAFDQLQAKHVDAVAVPPDTMFFNRRRQIADLAAAKKLPAIYGFREHVEDGGLISYGPDMRENYRRAASFVDKILKGAKPSELPVEQPTKIELVLNLRAAKTLGLSVPTSLLARADEVIE